MSKHESIKQIEKYDIKPNDYSNPLSRNLKYFHGASSEFKITMEKKYLEIENLNGKDLLDFIDRKTESGVSSATDKLLLLAALTKYADNDPGSALDYFSKNKHISDNSTFANMFLEYLSNGGMDTNDYVNKITDLIALSKSTNFKNNAFLSCVNIIDQPEVLALIKKFAKNSPYELRASSFFSRLASTDPYIALSVIEGLEMDERSKNYAYGDIYEQLSLTDPKGAFEKIISSNSSDMESVSLTDVCLNWLKINPTEAFKEIKNLDAIKFLGVISNPAVSKMLADSNADVNDIFKIIESVPLTQTNMSQIEKAVMFATPKDHSVANSNCKRNGCQVG